MTTVLPAGVLDASHATDSIIMAGWVLDTAIDAGKVKAAWSVLITHWPILVSRLRRDSKTRTWEYHIPEHPSLEGSFAALLVSGLIRAHYAYTTPSDTISCYVKANPQHLFSPMGPKSVDDLLEKDRPLVHLHVTTFDDGSLVGISVPHILCDGHGVTAIVQSLCSILRTGAAPPPLNLSDPFLAYVPEHCDVPAPPYWRVITKLEGIVLFIRTLWASLFQDEIENRDVYIPQREVLRIKEVAMGDIRAKHGSDTKLYVSSSDAVLAFLLKCAHASTSSSAPLNVFYTANMRDQLSMPPPYLRNTVNMVITPSLPVGSISKLPLGELALHIRSTVQSQSEKAAVETWLRWRLANAERPKIFFSPWRGRWDVVTNWRAMKLMDVDFSGAISTSREKGGSGAESAVRCVYAWGNGLQPYKLQNWFGLWADDKSGGIWTSAFLPKSVWRKRDGFGPFIRD